MTWRRWAVLLGVVVVVGAMKVAEQTAIVCKAYVVGKQTARARALENQTQWLARDVSAMQSPVHLAQVIETKHMNLVGWSPLPSAVNLAHRPDAARAGLSGTDYQQLAHTGPSDAND